MNVPTPPGRRIAKPRSGAKSRAFARKPAPQPQENAPEVPLVEAPAPSELVPVASEPPAAQPPSSAPAPMPEAPAIEASPAPEASTPEPVAEAPAPEMPASEAGTEAASPEREANPARRTRDARRREERRARREERRQAQSAGEARAPQPQGPSAQEMRPAQSPTQERPQTMGPLPRGLTLLGAKSTVYSDRYTPALLEAFENRHQANDFFVKFNCPEFTSLCPITGQPDFATLYISYIPDRKMVESKSLKLYLFGFRNHGAFHEDCVNTILEDLVRLLAPRYIEVWGKFLPRGGLSIDPYANYGRPSTRWEEFARQRLLMHDLSPERVDNR